MKEMIFSSWPIWIQAGLTVIGLVFLLALCIWGIVELVDELRAAFNRKYGRSNRDIDAIAFIVDRPESYKAENKLEDIKVILQHNLLARSDFPEITKKVYPGVFIGYEPWSILNQKMEDPDATKKV